MYMTDSAPGEHDGQGPQNPDGAQGGWRPGRMGPWHLSGEAPGHLGLRLCIQRPEAHLALPRGSRTPALGL